MENKFVNKYQFLELNLNCVNRKKMNVNNVLQLQL